MRTLEAYAAAVPRLQAGRTLVMAEAALLGGGNLKNPVREWNRLRAIADGGEVTDRVSGLGALALFAAANERARAKGELWEQRVAAEAGAVS